MSLTSLPNELLYDIVSRLHDVEIERLARALNRQLYSICLPLLTHRLTAKRNASRMRSLFGAPYNRDAPPLAAVSEASYKDLDLESKYGPYVSPSSTNFDYLDLRGNLSWLVPPAPFVAEQVEQNFRYYTFPDIRIEELVASAETFGVVIPDSFLSFIRNSELQRRIPTLGWNLFSFDGGRLRQFPTDCSNNIGGYILRFLESYDEKQFLSLYLDAGRGKGHCGLRSYPDPSIGSGSPFERVVNRAFAGRRGTMPERLRRQVEPYNLS